MTLPKLLLALPDGTVTEHPVLLAAVRSGDDIGVPGPGEDGVLLPEGGSLANLPGRRPIGIDPETGDPVVLHEVRIGRETVVPDAVAAVLPPGYTRAYLPAAHDTPDAPLLTQWAYMAVAWDEERGHVVHALHTDRRSHWSPTIHSTPDLPAKVDARRGTGRLIDQLAICALEYSCFTAQNVFYARDEAAIPASTGCNARCIGCISDQPEDSVPASHERMSGPPSAEEMAELGLYHFENATETQPGRAMISFGQGCEGEPLTRAGYIARAIRLVRERTDRGSININTNGSRPEAMQKLVDAGLDACRISLNSAHPELYAAYYKPVGYTFDDVRRTLAVARDGGLYIALNLLTFPGVTDRAGEIDLLCELVEEFGVHQVQTRNLALDPEQYLEVARGAGAGGEALGVDVLIRRLKKTSPKPVVGNFARGLEERGDWQRPATKASGKALRVVGER